MRNHREWILSTQLPRFHDDPHFNRRLGGGRRRGTGEAAVHGRRVRHDVHKRRAHYCGHVCGPEHGGMHVRASPRASASSSRVSGAAQRNACSRARVCACRASPGTVWAITFMTDLGALPPLTAPGMTQTQVGVPGVQTAEYTGKHAAQRRMRWLLCGIAVDLDTPSPRRRDHHDRHCHGWRLLRDRLVCDGHDGERSVLKPRRLRLPYRCVRSGCARGAGGCDSRMNARADVRGCPRRARHLPLLRELWQQRLQRRRRRAR